MNPEPLTIVYQLVIQCARPQIGVIAEYTAATPFPNVKDSIELMDCDPHVWDVLHTSTRVLRDANVLYCQTRLLVDTPVLDNRDRAARETQK